MVTTCWPHCTYFQALTASVKPWFLCDTPSASPPPWTSFLSLTHFFYLWIKSVLPFFPDFVLFRYFLGTFVETMKPRAPVSSRFLLLCTHTTSWQHVCEACWRFLGVRGSTVEGLQTPAELSHPLSPPCFLLPDELWLAGLIVCVQQTNVGSLTGLSKLRPPSSN